MDDLVLWLDTRYLGSYAPALAQNGYTCLLDIKEASDEDTRSIIRLFKKPGHRLKARILIDDLRHHQPPPKSQIPHLLSASIKFNSTGKPNFVDADDDDEKVVGGSATPIADTDDEAIISVSAKPTIPLRPPPAVPAKTLPTVEKDDDDAPPADVDDDDGSEEANYVEGKEAEVIAVNLSPKKSLPPPIKPKPGTLLQTPAAAVVAIVDGKEDDAPPPQESEDEKEEETPVKRISSPPPDLEKTTEIVVSSKPRLTIPSKPKQITVEDANSTLPSSLAVDFNVKQSPPVIPSKNKLQEPAVPSRNKIQELQQKFIQESKQFPPRKNEPPSVPKKPFDGKPGMIQVPLPQIPSPAAPVKNPNLKHSAVVVPDTAPPQDDPDQPPSEDEDARKKKKKELASKIVIPGLPGMMSPVKRGIETKQDSENTTNDPPSDLLPCDDEDPDVLKKIDLKKIAAIKEGTAEMSWIKNGSVVNPKRILFFVLDSTALFWSKSKIDSVPLGKISLSRYKLNVESIEDDPVLMIHAGEDEFTLIFKSEDERDDWAKLLKLYKIKHVGPQVDNPTGNKPVVTPSPNKQVERSTEKKLESNPSQNRSSLFQKNQAKTKSTSPPAKSASEEEEDSADEGGDLGSSVMSHTVGAGGKPGVMMGDIEIQKMLIEGQFFTKYKHGRPKRRHIWAPPEMDKIYWGSDKSNAKGYILISDIGDITEGCKGAKRQELAFSISTPDRNLELEAPNPQVKARWMEAVRIMSTAKSNKSHR